MTSMFQSSPAIKHQLFNLPVWLLLFSMEKRQAFRDVSQLDNIGLHVNVILITACIHRFVEHDMHSLSVASAL